MPADPPPAAGTIPGRRLGGQQLACTERTDFERCLAQLGEPASQAPPGPETKAPIVVLGAGSIVRDAHLPAYLEAGYSVLGVFDRDPEHAEHVRQQFGLPRVFADLEQAAYEGARQGAVFDIALPPDAIEPTLAQLPEGSAVLIQKPLGKSLSAAQRIAALCQARGLRTAVNFQLPLSPQIFAAFAAYRSGLIGDLTSASVELELKTEWSTWPFVLEEPRIEILLHSIHYLSVAAFYWGRPSTVSSVQWGDPTHPLLKQRDVCSKTRLGYALPHGAFEYTIACNHLSTLPREAWKSELRLGGEHGEIWAKIADNLDYPHGVDDQLLVTHDRFGSHAIPLVGNRFPRAFMATMGELQRAAAGAALAPLNDLEFALLTMQLAESCYASGAQGGPPLSVAEA